MVFRVSMEVIATKNTKVTAMEQRHVTVYAKK